MVRYCAAFGCNVSGAMKFSGVSFHHFPLKNEKLLKVWIHNLKRLDFEPTKHSLLCSLHFEEDCFAPQTSSTGFRLLKENAVPTIFSFKEQASKRKRTSYQFGQSQQTEEEEQSEEIAETEEVNEHLRSTHTQTEGGIYEQLLPEISDLQEENRKLKEKLHLCKHNYGNVPDDKTMVVLTGFTKKQFNVIFNLLNIENDMKNAKQSYFMFLVRLKNGVSEEFLSYMFKIPQSTISVTMNSIIDIMYSKIKTACIWPSKEKNFKYMPPELKKYYSSCRVIIDCTEFQIQKPSNPYEQQLTFSYYKNCNTVKCMIGITPSGAICFISDIYGGVISDKEIFLKSGILNLLESGDSILADRGFLIEKELEAIGCKLYRPHFLKDKIQFNLVERKENKKIARHRVHVERAIWGIKKYRFFEGAIPYKMLHSLSKIIYITAFLTNIGNPLINY